MVPPPRQDPGILWTPPADVRETTEIGRYLTWLERERGLSFSDYDDLWRWSVDDLPAFWSSIWDFFEVRSQPLTPRCSPPRRCRARTGSRTRA